MTAVYLNAMGVVCALGQGAAAVRAGLFAPAPSGLVETTHYSPGRPLHLGCIPGDVPALPATLPLRFQSRNNALLLAALAELRAPVEAAIGRYGPTRVAVVLGISAAGLEEGARAARQLAADGRWPADYDYAQQEMGNGAAFLAHALGIRGPSHVISTACSSSAKAMASAARLLRAGFVDAVVTGGADALSAFTVAGFSALDAVSAARCNPLSVNRSGINIGEAAALFLMTREAGPVRLAGWGESSDAHHMSAPEPTGRGAIAAMRQALARADIAPAQIDYVNLHGTGTQQNDAMEALAVAEVLGCDVPTSSTKPLTGHALAAAGAVEAVLAWQTLVDNAAGLLPPHWWDGCRDPALAPITAVAPGDSATRPPKYVLSNSFAFGGSNACLILAGA
ncbi:MAG: beta-ketoacyl-[acyl-carrier-protein] synthase [Rhodoferax sp.]|nr:beta-ketoacyl-[acyl-carrier-protein] synthase [Rhodoferax sp.]